MKTCIKKMNFERIIAHKTNRLSLEIISKKGKKTNNNNLDLELLSILAQT